MPVFCASLSKLEFSTRDVVKNPFCKVSLKFVQWEPSGSMRTHGRADREAWHGLLPHICESA